MVGALPAGDALDAVRRALAGSAESAAPACAARTWVAELWEKAGDGARDLGDLFGRFLGLVFAGEGLVVVDSRSPALGRAARPLLARYLERSPRVSEALAARAREISHCAPGPELSAEALAWCLFEVIGNGRAPLPLEGRLERARALLAEDPPALSPNVALRPVVEDYLFPHVARVAGPSELLYHEELEPAYAVLEVPRPVPVARLASTHVPLEARRLLGTATEPALAELWADFDGAVERAAARAESSAAVREALGALRRSWEEGAGRLRQALGGAEGAASPGFGERVERAARKVDYEMGRLEEGWEEVGRRELYRRTPRLRNLKEYVFPRGGAQERTLSSTDLLLLLGRDAAGTLVELAERHLERLSAGEWRHFVIAEGSEG